MNAASKDIATLLASAGLGLTLADNLVYGRLPADVNDMTAISDNPGGSPMLTLKQSTSAIYNSAVNIQVRNSNYDTGYALIQSITEYLHARHGDIINGTDYLLIRAIDDPSLLAYDENNRPIFSVNFEIQRK